MPFPFGATVAFFFLEMFPSGRLRGGKAIKSGQTVLAF